MPVANSLVLTSLIVLSLPGRIWADPFHFENLENRAASLAEKPFVPFPENPPLLSNLSYDQYRAIISSEKGQSQRKDGTPFRIEFLHPGYLFRVPVKIHFLDPATREPALFPFDPELFDYSELVLPEKLDTATIRGYAGFRIQHPLHGIPENFDEIGSFAGSSYFRLLGKNQRYGISARGLALNVAHHAAPEEFPVFTEYWIVRPEKDDTTLTFYALLESESVTGAFEFVVHPGDTTSAAIRSSLYFRKEVASAGLAPLTSMFWYGENSQERRFHDWRPEVHDSDGLLFHTWNDERVWRPLFNGEQIRYTHFNAPDLQGFGLMQRDRNFHHYEDLSNPYHLTPTAWVQPGEKWGEGAVRLIELPTVSEADDNIVSFFEPRTPPRSGDVLKYSYTLGMKLNDEKALSPNRAESTRVGVDTAFPDTRRFVIDFDGPELQKLAADAGVFAEISSSANGFINENQCFKNVMTGGWRVEFKLDTDDDNEAPVELRCLLKLPSEDRILTETWSYQWSP
ncbi:glucan biosynthesis protein G [Verrucomicrobiales bacterium BCK34]|nr:glucan biosynthesis protein G [Verrucomicrobiales bacterium BCK34]